MNALILNKKGSDPFSEWIADFIDWLRQRGLSLAEPEQQAEEEWMTYVAAQAEPIVFNSCNSWYVGANVEGKARIFMPFVDFPLYVARCEEIVAEGYPGFVLSWKGSCSRGCGISTAAVSNTSSTTTHSHSAAA